MSFTFQVGGGQSLRLPTGGKYCPKDIVVTAQNGEQSQYMWAPYIRSGTQLFREVVFPENTELTIEFQEIRSNLQQMVQDTKNLKKLTVILLSSSDVVLDAAYMCRSAESLEVVDFSKFHRKMNVSNAFMSCKKIREVIGQLDLGYTMALTNIFEQCAALEEVRIVPQSVKVNFKLAHSSKLSDETIQSVIDGLVDLTGATTQTLTFHANVGAKLTDEQKAAITAKNWTLVY